MTPGRSAVPRRRLDEESVTRGLAPTRAKARALIMAGDVTVNGTAVLRAGQLVSIGDELRLADRPRFVSRGGEKLDHALTVFGIDVAGTVALDLGASTGGFTDCLLQRGAARVYSVDVGYGQIDERLRRDERVVVMERTNARYLKALPEAADIATIDVSFISLGLILPVAARLLKRGGRCIPLIKPQFEAGRSEVGKGGVVRDAETHRRVLERVAELSHESGFAVCGMVSSPLTGPAGNVEFLSDLRLGDPPSQPPDVPGMIVAALDQAAVLAERTASG